MAKDKKPIEACYKLFGAKIALLRETLGLTQQDVAARMGMTRASIANIEAGNQRILLDDVEKFARAFASTPKALLRGIWT